MTLPCLCHKPRSIAAMCCMTRGLLSKLASPQEAFLTYGGTVIFSPQWINMILVAVNLVDAYSAANFAPGISTGDE